MLQRLVHLLGLDPAIAYSLTSKVVSAFAQPATLYFITTSLSVAEQGYYYTFYSVLALTIFLELGLGVVITHFSSNEFGALRWTAGGAVAGDELALGRLLSIVRKSLVWYAVIVLLSVVGLIPVGLRLFALERQHASVDYVWPWIWLIVASGLGTALIPLIAMLGGSGRIAELQRLKLAQNIAGSLILCGGLASGARLYAPALMLLVQNVIFLTWLFTACRGLVGQVLRYRPRPGQAAISWRTEILPMQWRVAASWLSAYFIGYTTNPLLLAYRGAEEAGQMGMSRQITDQVTNVGMPWVSTRTVTFGVHVNRGDYATLDRTAVRSALQGMAIAACGSLAAIAAILLAPYWYPPLPGRVLPVPAIGFLMVSAIGAIGVNLAGEYLRAHKQEPYLYVNLVLAIAVTISNVVAARYFNASIMAVSYGVVTAAIGWPLAAYVFTTRRRRLMRARPAPAE